MMPWRRFIPALSILLLLPGCLSLRLVQLTVPRFASLGQPVEMRCQFDTGNAKLYSVKWYKDGDEFCRFMPGYQPQSQLFQAPGIRMDESGCRMTNVTLKSAMLDTTGAYRCEVSTESPNFETVFRTENLTVRALPKIKPKISGVVGTYIPGEWVVATCTAGRSLPAATLQWLLNGQPADKSWVTGSVVRSRLSDPEGDDIIDDEDDDEFGPMDMEQDIDLDKPGMPEGDDPYLLATRSTIRFQARPEHFSGLARELVLRCEARLHELSWADFKTASLAGPGGKQHLARHEEPRHNLADVTAPHLLLILLLRMAAMLVS